MEITKEMIEEWRAACEAAEQAPWAYFDNGFDGNINNADGYSVFGGEPCEGRIEPDDPNMLFVCAARTALPAALDALEAYMQRESEKDAEIARLTAERDAAARDLKWLSNEYKFCVTCKRDNGRGVWDCNDERCNAENHYEWRGLCSSNTDAPSGAGSDDTHVEKN